MRRTIVTGLGGFALLFAGCGSDGDDGAQPGPPATEAMVEDTSADTVTTTTTDPNSDADPEADEKVTSTTAPSPHDGIDVCSLLSPDDVKDFFDANADTQGVMPFSAGYEAQEVADGEAFTHDSVAGCTWEVATFNRAGYDAYAAEQTDLGLEPAGPETFGTNPFTLTLELRGEITDTCLVATDDLCLYLPEVPADGEPAMPADLAATVEGRLPA